MMRRQALIAALASTFLKACLPYSYGSTSRVTPVGDVERQVIVSVIPRVERTYRSDYQETLPSVDAEARTGMTEQSDVGLRVVGGTGLVGSVKYRFGPIRRGRGAAIEPMLGVLEFGRLALIGATAVASTDEANRLSVYGGVRYWSTRPLERSTLSDRPTVGAFLGVRLGDETLGMRPEIGVFHDPPAQGPSRGALLVIPSVTFRMERILDLLYPPRRGR